jgi:hypothetical protein
LHAATAELDRLMRIALVSLALLAVTSGCAANHVKAPAPAAGVLDAPYDHALRNAVVLETVENASVKARRSITPLVHEALANAGLASTTETRARYALKITLDAPSVERGMRADYLLFERQSGRVVFERSVDTQDVYAAPGAPRIGTTLVGGEPQEVVPARSTAERAVAANIDAFLIALFEEQKMPVTAVLPCHGAAETAARKRALMVEGATFRTDDCAIPR